MQRGQLMPPIAEDAVRSASSHLHVAWWVAFLLKHAALLLNLLPLTLQSMRVSQKGWMVTGWIQQKSQSSCQNRASSSSDEHRNSVTEHNGSVRQLQQADRSHLPSQVLRCQFLLMVMRGLLGASGVS